MVVFFDIDGTIVDEESQIIPESAARAIRLLHENGHVPVVNTGRSFTHLDPRIRTLGFDGFVCASGMEVVLSGEYVYQDYITAEQCNYVFEQSDKYNMLIQAEMVGTLYYDANRVYTYIAQREAERLAEKGIRIIPYQEVEDRSFIKFVAYETEGSDRDGFLKATEHLFDYMFHKYDMVEGTKKGNSKAKGMERLLEMLGTPKEESFALGDSGNDLAMFAAAGTTICMGNGVDELKEKADYVTDSVLEDGVFNALRHYGLI